MSLTGKTVADKILRGKISGLEVIYTDTYEIAVKNGFEGTVDEWLASLKGETGPAGPAGPRGPKGDPGDTVTDEHINALIDAKLAEFTPAAPTYTGEVEVE